MTDDYLNTSLATNTMKAYINDQSLFTDLTGNTIVWQALFTTSKDLLFTKKYFLHALRAYVYWFATVYGQAFI